jgi:hypothetical protein
MEGEIIGGNPSPSLSDLNKKAIQKLYELMDSLDGKSDPDMVRACVESLAKLNSSIKGSSILPQEETDEERIARESRDAIQEAMQI